MDLSITREIGDIGNYYGSLKVKQEHCKFAWSIENFDGDEWEEIPEYLFAALNRFEDGKKGVSTDISTDHPPTHSPPPVTNPTPTPQPADPVAWCRSDDFRDSLLTRMSLVAWREPHPDCDMALYAQPQASATAPDADHAEGLSVDDVVELCQEFGFHLADPSHPAVETLRDMITAAITRWPLPVARLITSDWQPIETAPRDGTWVLLTGGECESNEESDNRGRVVTAQWTTEYRSNAGDRLIADFGRWEFAYYDSGVYGEYENPTFWQPLPSPPNTPSH
jgi:hypothetical protein